jgi:hypothetical protein
MRLTTDLRAVGALAVTALALAGCDSRRSGGSGSAVVPVTGASGTSPGTGPSPREAAESLLKAVAGGRVTPEQLTPAFRAAIASPQTDDERKAGYSAPRLRQWLDGFTGARFMFLEQTRVGSAVVERGRVEAGTAKDAFSLRIVPGGAGYQIDWLHRSTHLGLVPAPANSDLVGPQDAVRNFLDLLLGGDPRQAQLLMTLGWKKAQAPAPPAEARKGAEYDAGFLAQAMRAWKGDAAAYAIPKAEMSPARDAATFTVELEAAGRKTPYTVQAVKDLTTGWWLIAAFDKQP